ncbi:hypothetical protein HRU45_04750 [Candidatus Dependentiae bacterium]|nr:hypothetical protein [Candidatus Dependentiae bacterium]
MKKNIFLLTILSSLFISFESSAMRMRAAKTLLANVSLWSTNQEIGQERIIELEFDNSVNNEIFRRPTIDIQVHNNDIQINEELLKVIVDAAIKEHARREMEIRGSGGRTSTLIMDSCV